MKTQSMLLAALASVPAVLAHTVFTDFYVDGMPQVCGHVRTGSLRTDKYRVTVLPCV
jgi:hypothetical protein